MSRKKHFQGHSARVVLRNRVKLKQCSVRTLSLTLNLLVLFALVFLGVLMYINLLLNSLLKSQIFDITNF